MPTRTKKHPSGIWVLILEIALTIGVFAVVAAVTTANVAAETDRYARSVESDYQMLVQKYTSVYRAIANQTKDEIATDPSFAEMNAWLQNHERVFSDAVGSDVYDGFAITYKGGYAHSWNYGDYSTYNPDERPWYQVAAQANGQVALTAPYVTYVGGQNPDSDQYMELSVVERYTDTISFDMDLKMGEIDSLLINNVSAYEGSSSLLFDPNGNIISTTDRTLYCHNVNTPDDAISQQLSSQLVSLKDNCDKLMILNLDGHLEFVYASQDVGGNTFCVMIPFWLLITRNFSAMILVMALLIALEIVIYVVNRRTVEEMSIRDNRITDIAKAAFRYQIQVDLNTMECVYDDATQSPIVSSDYRELYGSLLGAAVDATTRQDLAEFMSPKVLVRNQDDDLVHARFVLDMPQQDGTKERKVFALSRFTSIGGKHPAAFILGNDVSEEERDQRQIMQSIAHRYSVVFMGDAESRKVDTIKTNLYFTSVSATGQSFAMLQSAYAATYLKEAYVQDYLDAVSFDTIAERLSAAESYAMVAELKDDHWFTTRVIRSIGYEESHKFIISMENVDDQMSKQKELETALRDAKEASAAKSEFLSRMSHDIRTPLNGIIGMTRMAREQQNAPKTVECLEKIDVSSHFLLGLVNDILDISTVESHALTFHREPYPSDDFLAYLDAVVRPLAEQKGIVFKVRAEALHDGYPAMDKLRTNQIAFNLLSNAVKYTPEGGTVEFTLEEHMVDETHMAVTGVYADTGIGMSKEFQKTMFEPFSQEGGHVNGYNESTGLGLAIVKRFMDAMGGTLTVKSAPGEGTVITTYSVHEYVPADMVTKEAAEHDGEGGDIGSLRGKHVLLVEDHPLNVEIAVAMLQKAGMIVSTAEDGKQGLDAFAESPVGYYDIVLMDVRMPVMNGYEASRAIRALERADASSVPIVAMTADAYSDDVEQAHDAGMNTHVGKPVEPEKLYAVLVRLCGHLQAE